ncbi:NADH-quinone oxidoreductase subunit N [Chryseolinea sp. T2]|uniref:NADH-quinone oxidoreductase subunit N n=1 Tax=Chryseolinea sp. T2 TaxID=3129255 RepID=UPI0030774262
MNALFVICGLGIAALVAEIVNLKKWLTAFVIVGLVAAMATIFIDFGTSTMHFSEMLQFDNFSLAFSGLIVVTTIFWFWLANDYFRLQPHITDRTALVLFTVAGAVIMASFNNMAMLFLGIEILSISLYVLAGSRKESLFSTEAAFKYFLMGSFATGFLLMGIALIYGATGAFHLTKIAEFIDANPAGLPTFFYAGILLMFIGLAFKISAVPFHFWAPDVYEGAPTSITAFMSTVVKIAALAAFYRVFFIFSSVDHTLTRVIQGTTILTLVIPNITAVYQQNVKRMLAYSSVGHVGYILLGFLANATESANAIFYYLCAYACASLTAFAVLHVIGSYNRSTTVEYFNGLFKRNPILAVAMTFALLSLAAIPPLPGFFGKYMIFAMAIEQGYTGLVILAIITSLIGVYYYFRIIIAMYFQEPSAEPLSLGTSTRVLLIALIAISLILTICADRFVGLVG